MVCLPRSLVTLISVIGLTPASRCSANTLSRIQYFMISWNGSSSDGFLKYGSCARKIFVLFFDCNIYLDLFHVHIAIKEYV